MKTVLRYGAALCLLGILLVSNYTVEASEKNAQPAARSAPPSLTIEIDTWRFINSVRLLRTEFVELRASEYRLRMFDLLHELPELTPAMLSTRFELLLRETTTDADGLEPLVLAYADAIAERGTATARKAAVEQVLATSPKVRYGYKKLFPGFLVPVGRVSTRLVIDMRADMVRAAFLRFLNQPNGLSNLDELFAYKYLRDDACQLKPLDGLPTTLSPDAVLADTKRQNDCSNGALGEKASDMLMATAVSSCLNISPDAYKDTDQYTIAEMSADIEQCLSDMSNGEIGNPLAEGPTFFEKLLSRLTSPANTLIETARAAGSWAGRMVEKVLDYYLEKMKEERKQASADRKALIDAEVDAVKAGVKMESATERREHANRDLKRAIDDVNDAEGAVSGAERNYEGVRIQHNLGLASDEDLKAANDKLDYERGRLGQAETRREEAKEKLRNAEEAERGARADYMAAEKKYFELKKSQDQDDRSEYAELSPACSRLITNGKDFDDPVDIEKLPENWASLESRLKKHINPNPETAIDPHASDALGLPACGADTATLRGAAVDCNKPVHCTDPSEQCGCSKDALASEADLHAFLNKSQELKCAMTARCPNGTMGQAQGIVCTCVSPSSGGETPPKPRPMPISKPIIEALFLSTGASMPMDVRADPLSTFTRDFIRR